MHLIVLFMKRFRELPADFLMNWFVMSLTAALVITSEPGGHGVCEPSRADGGSEAAFLPVVGRLTLCGPECSGSVLVGCLARWRAVCGFGHVALRGQGALHGLASLRAWLLLRVPVLVRAGGGRAGHSWPVARVCPPARRAWRNPACPPQFLAAQVLAPVPQREARGPWVRTLSA